MIVWAGTVGAALGPNLLDPAGTFAAGLGRAEYVGGYLLATVFLVLAFTATAAAFRPSHDDQSTALPPTRGVGFDELRRALQDPLITVGVVSMIAGHVVMVLIMTGTPIHLEDGGYGLDVVGGVISAHTIGMFAFAPLTGRLIERFGHRSVLGLAISTLGSASILAFAAPQTSVLMLGLALFLLGLGWNFGFVGGSALVAKTGNKRLQGQVDAVVWVSSAVASVSSGLLLDGLGYRALALFGLLLLGAPLVPIRHTRDVAEPVAQRS
jgi:MFS family permease